MKTRLIIINIMMALLVCSCNSEKSEYFKNITKDGEIVVNYTDHKGKNIEILWAIIDGKVDYFTTNSKQFTRSYTGSFDCRLSKLVKAGPYRMLFESPKNKPAFEGDDYYYEVELKFDLPKDPTQEEYEVDGTIYITGQNAGGDGGDISDTYDAQFKIFYYPEEVASPKREEENVDTEEVVNKVKNILNEEVGTPLNNGNYCFQFDDLANSGDFYYCNLAVENENDVKGELTVENEASESYTINFNGKRSGEVYTVSTTYSNDGGGPYEEKWKINSNGLTLEQPTVTLSNIKCD